MWTEYIWHLQANRHKQEGYFPSLSEILFAQFLSLFYVLVVCSLCIENDLFCSHKTAYLVIVQCWFFLWKWLSTSCLGRWGFCSTDESFKFDLCGHHRNAVALYNLHCVWLIKLDARIVSWVSAVKFPQEYCDALFCLYLYCSHLQHLSRPIITQHYLWTLWTK